MTKPKVVMIVAMDEANGIGKDNALLCHLPADLKHFKETTINKSIVMGYNTYLSIGKPLPKRQNIVLSRQQRNLENVTCLQSPSEVLEHCQYEDEIMIIGGGQIYDAFLPMADSIIASRIHTTFNANVYFPAIDESSWIKKSETFVPADENNAYSFSIEKYIRA